MAPIPVIDLFAGPGGLGEGFASQLVHGTAVYRIRVSIEKDPFARMTLKLRSFYRQFNPGKVPETYYEFARGHVTLDELYRRHSEEAAAADWEAYEAELGKKEYPDELIDARIHKALGEAQRWALIGGPPCQAYSLVGRSRQSKLRKKSLQKFEDDEKHVLYQEYLRIIAAHEPPVFVMENVKGLLSSTLKGQLIVDQILSDLRTPSRSVHGRKNLEYKLWSFVVKPTTFDLAGHPVLEARDFTIEAEDYGIPQCRHRVIILGVRSDLTVTPSILTPQEPPSLTEILQDLPPLRSKVSGRAGGLQEWATCLNRIPVLATPNGVPKDVRDVMCRELAHIGSHLPTGGPFVRYAPGRPSGLVKRWYRDTRLDGITNHESRGHMAEDLQRYFFAACYAAVRGRSPVLSDFPRALLPKHANVHDGVDGKVFADRFRVQLPDKPATTVTSHISKDGHYFIHPDPRQCRSLTVREAARVQTFPDNYIFLGPRTSQYQQVGNAVPPKLAQQLAKIVHNIFKAAKQLT